jgi:hypothetical protein
LIYELGYKDGVQRTYILGRSDRGSDVGMEEHMERYEVHVGKGRRMEKAYGGGMVTKGDMWDNVVTMKGRRYAMESELTKRR